MIDIIFATKNPSKIKEVQKIMKDSKFNIISMTDAGIYSDIEEDGKTFEENAMKKACETAKNTGKIVLADDSGIEIDFLNKAPGVFSARFLGENTSYVYKNNKIIEMMREVPYEKRTARFVCVIAVSIPDIGDFTERAEFEGVIADEPAGEGGFGYDPIFYVPEYKMTASQMTPDMKNALSHRGKALRQMKIRLNTLF